MSKWVKGTGEGIDNNAWIFSASFCPSVLESMVRAGLTKAVQGRLQQQARFPHRYATLSPYWHAPECYTVYGSARYHYRTPPPPSPNDPPKNMRGFYWRIDGGAFDLAARQRYCWWLGVMNDEVEELSAITAHIVALNKGLKRGEEAGCVSDTPLIRPIKEAGAATETDAARQTITHVLLPGSSAICHVENLSPLVYN